MGGPPLKGVSITGAGGDSRLRMCGDAGVDFSKLDHHLLRLIALPRVVWGSEGSMIIVCMGRGRGRGGWAGAKVSAIFGGGGW